MATWGETKTTSTGGNVQMKLTAGYGSVSRSGNTVTAQVYGRMAPTGSWSSNEYAIWVPAGGTKKQLKKSGVAGSGTWEGYVNYSFNVGASDTSKSVSVGFGWNAWTATQGNTASVTIPFSSGAVSFNMNVLNPDGSEPYTTGEAGSVEVSINGGGYSRVYNEGASSYAYGTTFNYRNFTPGSHRRLSSVSGISPNNTTGPWSLTLTSGTTVNFQTAWNTYWQNVNVISPSGSEDGTSGYFDLYTSENNSWRYNLTDQDGDMTHTYGTYYLVKNIRPYYSYYVLDRVEGYDSIPESGTYRKEFNGGATMNIYMKYKSYVITFAPNGGTFVGGWGAPYYQSGSNWQINPVTYNSTTNNNRYFNADNIPRTGYTLKGFYTSAFGGTQVYNNSGPVAGTSYWNSSKQWVYDGNPTFYAQYTPVKPTITFDAQGGSGGTSVAKWYGTALGLSNNTIMNMGDGAPTGGIGNSSYSYNGSNVVITHADNTSNGGQYFPTGRITSGKVYTWTMRAKGSGTWTVGHEQGGTKSVSLTSSFQTFTHTFTANDGSYNAFVFYGTGANSKIEIETVSLQEGTPSLPTTTRVGYTFKGWYTAASGGTKVNPTDSVPSANTTYYAQWTPLTYTMVFNGNGSTGGSMSNMTMTEGSQYTLTANAFTRTGYTFTGWNSKADGTGVPMADKQVVRGVNETNPNPSFTAGRTPVLSGGMTYSATGSPASISPEYISYGHPSTRDCYLCNLIAGHTYIVSGYGVADSSAQSTSTVGVHYKTSSDGWYASENLPATQRGWKRVEKAFAIPSDSTTQHLWLQVNGNADNAAQLAGWYWTGVTCRDMSLSTTQTIYAQWNPNSYTVSYNANGGSGTTANSSHTYGVAKALTKNGFSKAGYKFLGWSTDSGAKVATYTDQQSVSNLTSTNGATVILYAVWEAEQAQLYTKKDGAWVQGPTYVKVNGAWVVAKQIYTKVNGEWKLNGGLVIITFTIDDISYSAESGMTWSQWVQSSYNTVGAEVDTSLDRVGWVDDRDATHSILTTSYPDFVKPSDTIIAGHDYNVFTEK